MVMPSAAFAVVLVATVSGCSRHGTPSSGGTSSSSSSTTSSPAGGNGPGSSTSSSATGPPVLPESGTYTDGPTGLPHYSLSLTSTPNGTLTGSLRFFFQDGTVSDVFTFTGAGQSGSAQVPTQGGPGTISMTYTSTTITLENCTQYLKYATSPAQCAFAAAATQ